MIMQYGYVVLFGAVWPLASGMHGFSFTLAQLKRY